MALSVVDRFNSTIQTLGAGETFLGQYTDIKAEGIVSVLINGDVSAPGVLSFEFSIDRVVVDSKEDIVIPDITDTLVFPRLVSGSFFRVRYVNGATPLATFRLETQKNKDKNIGFSIEEFQEVLESIELNTSITANQTNVVKLAFNEVDPVTANLEQTIVSYTTTLLKATWITRISISGQDNSRWRLFQAGSVIDIRRIGAGDINGYFNFGSPGLKIPAGVVTVDVKAFHEFTGRSPKMNATIYGFVEL